MEEKIPLSHEVVCFQMLWMLWKPKPKKCKLISLSIFLFHTDPNTWSTDHVQQWVQWTVSEYSLQEVMVNRFDIDGKQLCKMTRDDFTRLTSSYNADVLLSHLNFLRQGQSSKGLSLVFPSLSLSARMRQWSLIPNCVPCTNVC